jgi:hypothetical protein
MRDTNGSLASLLLVGVLAAAAAAAGCGGSSLQPPDSGSGGGGAGGAGGGPSTGNGGSGGSTSCALDSSYVYGDTGGFVLSTSQSTLSPPATYGFSSTSYEATPAVTTTCTATLPACDSAGVIDAADIMRDIADADVQAALAAASPPLYGRDSRNVDGTVFSLQRADGHGFLVGDDCAVPPMSLPCVPTPAGVAHFVADLRALDLQESQGTTCPRTH